MQHEGLHTTLHLGALALPVTYRRAAPGAGLVVVVHTHGGTAPCACLDLVPQVLQGYGLASLRLDLLDADEPQDAQHEADDLARQVNRLVLLLNALRAGRCADAGIAAGPGALGLFGADRGATVVLLAAARAPDAVSAVVGCSAHIDGVLPALSRLLVPTLLVVGEQDVDAVQAHRQVRLKLHGAHRVEVVPGASAGFCEPGALQTVAHQGATWLRDHLPVAA